MSVTAYRVSARQNGERAQGIQSSGRHFQARPPPLQAGTQVDSKELAAS
jgi:hypothetical protein